jgi:acetyltransferase
VTFCFEALEVSLPLGLAVAIRSARADDAPAAQAFVRGLSPVARRRRFFGALRELTPGQLERLIRPRDPRDLSLLAVAGGAADGRVVAMAQYALECAAEAEFGLVVGDGWQGRGLGQRLIETLLSFATRAGVRLMGGSVLATNAPMLTLAEKLGFRRAPDPDPDLVRVLKPLHPGMG